MVAQNLITIPETFVGWWGPVGGLTVTPGVTAAPDGSLTMERLEDSDLTRTRYLAETVVIGPADVGQLLWWSVIFKQDAAIAAFPKLTVWIKRSDANPRTAFNGTVQFDVATGQYQQLPGDIFEQIQVTALGDSWELSIAVRNDNPEAVSAEFSLAAAVGPVLGTLDDVSIGSVLAWGPKAHFGEVFEPFWMPEAGTPIDLQPLWDAIGVLESKASNQAKFMGVNVLDEDADPTGVSTSTLAFKNAMDKAIQNDVAGNVIIPGVGDGYAIDEAFRVPDTVSLIGSGNRTHNGPTLHMMNGVTGGLIMNGTFGGVTSYQHWTLLEGFTIRNHPTSPVVDPTVRGIWWTTKRAGEGWQIRNVSCIGLPSHGVNIAGGGTAITIDHFHAFGCAGYGLYIHRGAGNRNYTFRSTLVSGDGNGSALGDAAALVGLAGIAAADEYIQIHHVKAEILVSLMKNILNLDDVGTTVELAYASILDKDDTGNAVVRITGQYSPTIILRQVAGNNFHLTGSTDGPRWAIDDLVNGVQIPFPPGRRGGDHAGYKAPIMYVYRAGRELFNLSDLGLRIGDNAASDMLSRDVRRVTVPFGVITANDTIMTAEMSWADVDASDTVLKVQKRADTPKGVRLSAFVSQAGQFQMDATYIQPPGGPASITVPAAEYLVHVERHRPQ